MLRLAKKTLQLVTQKLKHDLEFQFCPKRNEKQFTFNESVSNSIQSFVIILEKVKSTAVQETAALKSAKEQLQQGSKAIVEHQKFIQWIGQTMAGDWLKLTSKMSWLRAKRT